MRIPIIWSILGVHSAKFAAEQDSKNIAEAIRRYKIEHPVINDAQHVLWDRFGVNSWPTVILIDPEGYAVWGTSGEITFEQIDKILKTALPYYRQKKLLERNAAAASISSGEKPRRRRCNFPERFWPTKKPTGCSSPTATITGSSSPGSTAR